MVCALIMLLAAQDHASTKRCHTIYRRLQGDLITDRGNTLQRGVSVGDSFQFAIAGRYRLR